MNATNLKACLQDHRAFVYPELQAKQRHAAVLILLAPSKAGPELIFTRRSESLSRHAGQISFPGGTVDADDPDPIQTALRESEEEIGLISQNVDILGTMEWYVMPSGFVVLPVIGQLLQSQSFVANPAEVVEIFSIPLQTLLDVKLYKSDTMTRKGIKRRFYYFEFKEHYVWGATAGMLRSLALLLSKT